MLNDVQIFFLSQSVSAWFGAAIYLYVMLSLIAIPLVVLFFIGANQNELH